MLAFGCCLAAVAGCGSSPVRPTPSRNLSPPQVVHAFADARLPLVRILGPPPRGQRDAKAVQRYLDRLNDFTTGVYVVGGTNIVFGAAKMPSKIKILIYPTPKSATAALALGQRLVANGRLPQPTGPVMIRRVRNVVIEMDATIYADNARSIQRALQGLNRLAGTAG
jgi:hypothetical protein